MSPIRPNILWICTSQQRYDSIAALGNPQISTPTLDTLIHEGAVFHRAYSQSTRFTASRASFMTGRYPESTHVLSNGTDHFPGSEVLVTRLLSLAGYRCGLIGRLHQSRAEYARTPRPDDGFEYVQICNQPWPDGDDYHGWLRTQGKSPAGLLAGLYQPDAVPYGIGPPLAFHQSTWWRTRAMEFVDQQDYRPWSLLLSLTDPHPPCHPPPEILESRNRRLSAGGQPATDQDPTGSALSVRNYRPVSPFEAPTGSERFNGARSGPDTTPAPSTFDLRSYRNNYFAAIETLDAQLGNLLDRLRERGQLDNTLVVFMSDHGEMLGDHGLYSSGCRFFDQLVHVPLVFWMPQLIRPSGRDTLVELTDIAPTLLQAAGVSIPDHMQGRSLWQMVIDESDDTGHRDYVTSDYLASPARPDDNHRSDTGSTDNGSMHGSMYFDGQYKLVVYHDRETGELFDLRRDPAESNNLWSDPASIDLLKTLLHRHLQARMLRTLTAI